MLSADYIEVCSGVYKPVGHYLLLVVASAPGLTVPLVVLKAKNKTRALCVQNHVTPAAVKARLIKFYLTLHVLWSDFKKNDVNAACRTLTCLDDVRPVPVLLTGGLGGLLSRYTTKHQTIDALVLSYGTILCTIWCEHLCAVHGRWTVAVDFWTRRYNSIKLHVYE